MSRWAIEYLTATRGWRVLGESTVDTGFQPPDNAETKLTVRCRAFGAEGARKNRVLVTDGTVLVWDDIAGHYTGCHSLSASAIRRIRRLAEVQS